MSHDRAVALALREIREEARISRARVSELVPGLKASALQSLEEGKQRVPIGLLVTLSGVYGVAPWSVLVRAGLVQPELSLEDVLDADDRLDSLARGSMTAHYEVVAKQADIRRRTRGH